MVVEEEEVGVWWSGGGGGGGVVAAPTAVSSSVRCMHEYDPVSRRSRFTIVSAFDTTAALSAHSAGPTVSSSQR